MRSWKGLWLLIRKPRLIPSVLDLVYTLYEAGREAGAADAEAEREWTLE